MAAVGNRRHRPGFCCHISVCGFSDKPAAGYGFAAAAGCCCTGAEAKGGEQAAAAGLGEVGS